MRQIGVILISRNGDKYSLGLTKISTSPHNAIIIIDSIPSIGVSPILDVLDSLHYIQCNGCIYDVNYFATIQHYIRVMDIHPLRRSIGCISPSIGLLHPICYKPRSENTNGTAVCINLHRKREVRREERNVPLSPVPHDDNQDNHYQHDHHTSQPSNNVCVPVA